MTKLRVLSGQHAGVFLDWVHSRLAVGPSEELDVYIGDWNVQRIELHRNEEGQHLACWPASDADHGVAGQQREGNTVVCPLEPWVPVCFGAIILCIGPSDEAWPDDAQLLQRCFAPDPPAAVVLPQSRRRPRGRGLLMVGMMVAFAVFAMPSSTSPLAASAPEVAAMSVAADTPKVPATALPRVAPAERLQPVQRLLAALGQALPVGLELVPQEERVVVRGVVTSRAEVDHLNNLLDTLPADLLVSRSFVAAPDVIDRLHESMPGSGLRIGYDGQNRFDITGMADDVARTSRAIEQVAADLADLGVRIDTQVQPRQKNALAKIAMSGMLIDADGTSFLRTHGDVKNIVSAAPAATSRARAANAARSFSTRAPSAQENNHASR
jgi:type III secretion protein D